MNTRTKKEKSLLGKSHKEVISMQVRCNPVRGCTVSSFYATQRNCWGSFLISSTELLKVSIIGMKLFSFSYLTGWVDMCFSSYFTALERPARSMLVSFFGTLIFPIVALFVMTPFLELNGVWLSSFVSCTASAVFTAILYSTLKVNKRED